MSTPKSAAKKPPRRHHYIPKFLLRQFALPDSVDRESVRCLTKNGVLDGVNINNVGVEGDFYPSGGMFASPEEYLAECEDEFAKAMREWLGQRRLTGNSARVAGAFAWHLRLRSKTMRVQGDQMFQAARAGFGAAFGRVAGACAQTVPLEDELRRSISAKPAGDDGVRQELAESLKRHLYSWLMEGLYGIRRDPSFGDILRTMLPHIHTTLVMQDLVDSGRSSDSKSFQWRVEHIDGPRLLLGDCGPLLRARRGAPLEHLFWTGQDSSVFLPIAPDRLLVGSRSLKSPLPNVETINQATIELSTEFVVGRWPVSKLERKAKQLGRRATEAINLEEITRQSGEAAEGLAQFAGMIVTSFVDRRLGPRDASGSAPAALVPSAVAPSQPIDGEVSADRESFGRVASLVVHSVMAAGNAVPDANGKQSLADPTQPHQLTGLVVVPKRAKRRKRSTASV